MIIKLAEKLKPYLLKILPYKVLKKIKDSIVSKKEKRLKAEGRKPFEPAKHEKGVNLIGGIRMQTGLGQSCRLIAELLEHISMPYTICEYCADQQIRCNDHQYDEKITNEKKYGINLLHLNPYELRMGYVDMGNDLLDYHYNIGYWLYELDKLPDGWIEAIDLVQEIWTPSEYTGNLFRKVTDKPVYTMPYSVSAPTDESMDRTYFGLPKDQFLYLVMYDTNSTSARKNPQGAIRAYKKAYPSERADVGLVVKVNHMRPEDEAFLKKELEGYQNVYFISKTLDKIEVNSLIKDVDVFVSLHRAEGFGLVMAEAMLNGTACIATNYSSNTEFMDEECACMVSYELVPFTGDTGQYPKGSQCAEASITEAASYMIKLQENPDFYQTIVSNAKKRMCEEMNVEKASKRIEKRLLEIYENTINWK